jgi:hypothetical protein
MFNAALTDMLHEFKLLARWTVKPPNQVLTQPLKDCAAAENLIYSRGAV